MKFEIRERLLWVQQRRRGVVLVLVSSCSASLLLLIPRVRALLIYFWPLLLSTALFVAALLTIDESKVEEKEEEEEEGTWQRDLEHVVEALPHLERERSIIECVAEQHEGGMLHFDTLFLQANGEEEVVEEQSLPEISEEKGAQSSVSTHKEA